MIKVVLVDDYAFVREGLKVLFGCYKSLEVVVKPMDRSPCCTCLRKVFSVT